MREARRPTLLILANKHGHCWHLGQLFRPYSYSVPRSLHDQFMVWICSGGGFCLPTPFRFSPQMSTCALQPTWRYDPLILVCLVFRFVKARGPEGVISTRADFWIIVNIHRVLLMDANISRTLHGTPIFAYIGVVRRRDVAYIPYMKCCVIIYMQIHAVYIYTVYTRSAWIPWNFGNLEAARKKHWRFGGNNRVVLQDMVWTLDLHPGGLVEPLDDPVVARCVVGLYTFGFGGG